MSKESIEAKESKDTERPKKIIKGQTKTYVISKTLGKGTFGKVKIAYNSENKDEKYACKILKKSNIKNNNDLLRVNREMKILSTIDHPNVIKTYEIITTEDCEYLLMEYCPKGELFNYIVENQNLTEERSAFFYYQLINGIDYLHRKGICHRDLKPENLLLTNDLQLKIIDFGLSNFTTGDLLETPCGSPCYASPEMVMGYSYDGRLIDIWSTGIILYAMLCGYLPFEEGENDKNNELLFENIEKCDIEYPDELQGEDALDLMKKILVKSPVVRLRIDEIKKHKFYLYGQYIYRKTFGLNEETDKSYLRDEAPNEIKCNNKESIENIENLKNKENIEIKEDKKENLETKLDNKESKEIKKDNKENKEITENIDNLKKKENIEIKINNNESKEIKVDNNESKAIKVDHKESKEIKEVNKESTEIKEDNKEVKKNLILNHNILGNLNDLFLLAKKNKINNKISHLLKCREKLNNTAFYSKTESKQEKIINDLKNLEEEKNKELKIQEYIPKTDRDINETKNNNININSLLINTPSQNQSNLDNSHKNEIKINEYKDMSIFPKSIININKQKNKSPDIINNNFNNMQTQNYFNKEKYISFTNSFNNKTYGNNCISIDSKLLTKIKKEKKTYNKQNYIKNCDVSYKSSLNNKTKNKNISKNNKNVIQRNNNFNTSENIKNTLFPICINKSPDMRNPPQNIFTLSKKSSGDRVINLFDNLRLKNSKSKNNTNTNSINKNYKKNKKFFHTYTRSLSHKHFPDSLNNSQKNFKRSINAKNMKLSSYNHINSSKNNKLKQNKKTQSINYLSNSLKNGIEKLYNQTTRNHNIYNFGDKIILNNIKSEKNFKTSRNDSPLSNYYKKNFNCKKHFVNKNFITFQNRNHSRKSSIINSNECKTIADYRKKNCVTEKNFMKYEYKNFDVKSVNKNQEINKIIKIIINEMKIKRVNTSKSHCRKK